MENMQLIFSPTRTYLWKINVKFWFIWDLKCASLLLSLSAGWRFMLLWIQSLGQWKQAQQLQKCLYPCVATPPPPLSQSQINTPTLTQTDSPRRTLTPPRPPPKISLTHSLPYGRVKLRDTSSPRTCIDGCPPCIRYWWAMERAGELGVEYKSKILVLDLKTFAI